jgi:hypothetical protein
MSKLLTLKDAAEFLGISRMKLWRLIRDGKLHPIVNELDHREKLLDFEELETLKSKGPTLLKDPNSLEKMENP